MLDLSFLQVIVGINAQRLFVHITSFPKHVIVSQLLICHPVAGSIYVTRGSQMAEASMLWCQKPASFWQPVFQHALLHAAEGAETLHSTSNLHLIQAANAACSSKPAYILRACCMLGI